MMPTVRPLIEAERVAALAPRSGGRMGKGSRSAGGVMG